MGIEDWLVGLKLPYVGEKISSIDRFLHRKEVWALGSIEEEEGLLKLTICTDAIRDDESKRKIIISGINSKPTMDFMVEDSYNNIDIISAGLLRAVPSIDQLPDGESYMKAARDFFQSLRSIGGGYGSVDAVSFEHESPAWRKFEYNSRLPPIITVMPDRKPRLRIEHDGRVEVLDVKRTYLDKKIPEALEAALYLTTSWKYLEFFAEEPMGMPIFNHDLNIMAKRVINAYR